MSEAALHKARELQRAGEPRAAIAAWEAALRQGAPALEANLQLGAIHAELGEHEAAAERFGRVLAEQPRHGDALCMLAGVRHDMGRFGEAARLLEEALALRPRFPEALFNLGLARFEQGDLARAAASIGACYALNRGEPWGREPERALGAPRQPAFAPHDMAVNRTKIRHDAEQLAYLLELGRLPGAFRAVLEDYQSLLSEIPREASIAEVVPFDEARHPLVAATYKRPVHLDPGGWSGGPLVNPSLDAADIARRYAEARPSVIAIDGLVTPQALAALRRFCRESTIWNDIKPGYLGAYFFDGFCSPLLLQLAHELRERLPGVIRGLPLQMMWGYKCDASLPALGIHADAASVNVNFWITEDEANLDPAHGGLEVYTHAAPADWGFGKYNPDPAMLERWLATAGGETLVFPYRANRAVIFDSDLFHASDRPRFREGYLNRRINITLLYGLRTS